MGACLTAQTNAKVRQRGRVPFAAQLPWVFDPVSRAGRPSGETEGGYAVSRGAPLEVLEFGRLSESQRAELEAGEEDPFDAAGNTLQWRPKDRHLVLGRPDGTLVASAGLVLGELHAGDGPACRSSGLAACS